MKANKKSIHTKLYKFTYKSNLPDNLCPYFWKLVAGILMFIPNLILQLPTLLFELVGLLFRYKSGNDCTDRRIYGFVTYMSIAVLSIYGSITYHWFKAMFNTYSYDWGWANLGWFINGVIIFFLLRYFYLRLRPSKSYEEKQPSIIIEFVKAKYHKYCPKIDWKD